MLAAPNGRWRSPDGSEVRIDTASGAIVARPGNAQAWTLVFGSRVISGPRADDLTNRTLAALRPAMTGDFAPLAKSFGTGIAPTVVAARQGRIIQGRTEALGPFVRLEPLGVRRSPMGPLVGIRYVHERGNDDWEVGWDDGNLVLLRPLGLEAGVSLFPVAGGGFTAFSFTGAPMALTVKLVGTALDLTVGALAPVRLTRVP
jgi:hypothetical protein